MQCNELQARYLRLNIAVEEMRERKHERKLRYERKLKDQAEQYEQKLKTEEDRYRMLLKR